MYMSNEDLKKLGVKRATVYVSSNGTQHILHTAEDYKKW
jgi:hypothetical protein